jgi:hypothetical protein
MYLRLSDQFLIISAKDLCYFYTEEAAFCDSFVGTGRSRGWKNAE